MTSYQIFIFLLLQHCFRTEVIQGNGSFEIYGIFPMINEEGDVNAQSGIMMSAAMQYAINEINKEDILYGYKLKIAKINELQTDLVRDRVLKTFLQEIPFMVGPYSSELSYISSILTATFQLVAISYSATYSDFSKYGMQDYIMRTVPSDSYRINAALDLLKELQWNYIGIISSYGYNGEREAIKFASEMSKYNICKSHQIDLPKLTSESEIKKALSSLVSDDNLKAVIMFTTNEDSRKIIRQIKMDNIAGRFFLLCMYGCTNYFEVVRGYENASVGIISIDIHSPEIVEFKKYFMKMKPDSKSSEYFERFWEDTFQCSLKNRTCSDSDKLSEGHGYYPLTPVHTVINAVSAISIALKQMIEAICDSRVSWMKDQTECVIPPGDPQMYTQHVFKILRNYDVNEVNNTGTLKRAGRLLPKEDYKVQYDIHHYQLSKGSYPNIKIGSWEFDRKGHKNKGVLKMSQDWHKDNETRHKFVARCSKDCPMGSIRHIDSSPDKQKCCWSCKKCKKNNIVKNNTCVLCKETEMVVIGSNKCLPLPTKYTKLNNPVPVIFTIISMTGLCFIVVVVGLFLKYNHFRLVRASGRDLCYMILFGIALTFICPFFFLGQPTVPTCLLRSALPGVAFLSCYAPLFLKTNRIYRIFCHAKRSVSRPALVSSRSLLLVSFGIVAVQIVFVGVWLVSKVPIPEAKVAKNKDYITMHCQGDASPILLLLNVALSVIFMISCTVLAFKTRHFPKNYNEAKYIGITLYITCVAWAIFLPAYFLIPEEDFVREYVMSGICIVIGYITLFGLFGQKVRLLACQKELDNANANLPTWYLSYSDCKDNGDAMLNRPDQNGNSDETIA